MIKKISTLILKAIVIIFALTGTFISMNAGSDTFMGGTSVLMYFTIQSNIALAIVCTIGAVFILRNKAVPKLWYVIKFVATISITLTGAVFAFVLAPTMGGHAWTNTNIYTHVIVPVASVIDFFVTGTDSEIPKKSVIYTTIPPIVYAVYAGIGYVCNWDFSDGINYPYFFLNWGSPAGAFGFCNELPYMGCAWWIIAIFVSLMIVGLIYLWILDLIKKVLKKSIKQ